ncbi:MAG TPA: EamA family transporter [Mobilitalea sp.]|nr:EamA family transporter [Mobilitalea sp.]
MYYIPLLLTVIANVLYHIAQKSTSEKINPMFSLMITYAIAFVLSCILFFFMKGEKSLNKNINELNWSSVLLGCSILLLELGFLLAYRVGWNIGTASFISTIAVTLVLIPIGLLFFKESFNLSKLIGIVLCILGLILLNKK